MDLEEISAEYLKMDMTGKDVLAHSLPMPQIQKIVIQILVLYLTMRRQMMVFL